MDARAVARACQAYLLDRDLRRTVGSLGHVRGAGVGSSVDFHDYREYQPGDDPRHVDWAVYGRTGELNVRLFHEEVHPSVDVLLDASRSMAIDDGRKAAVALELAEFALQSARLQGSRARLHLCGAEVEQLEHADGARFDADRSCLLSEPARCTRRLRRGGLRVVISDFMSSEPVSRAVVQLAAGAAQLVVLMTLGPWEAAPDKAPLATLADAESGEELSTALGARAVERYLARLETLQKDAEAACRAVGGVFVRVVCDRSLWDVLRAELLPRGVVVPV